MKITKIDLSQAVKTLDDFLTWIGGDAGLMGPLEHYQARVTYYRVCDTAFAGDTVQDQGVEKYVDTIEHDTVMSWIYVTDGEGGLNEGRRIHQVERLGAVTNPKGAFVLTANDVELPEVDFLALAVEGDRYSRALVEHTHVSAPSDLEIAHPTDQQPALAYAKFASEMCALP